MRQRWKASFGNKTFKTKFIVAFSVLIVVVICLPFFFSYIEKRSGIELDDIILRNLLPNNVSLFIFGVMWSVTLLMLVRAVQQPSIFILLLSSFTLLTLVRIVSIWSFALNPPPGLIVLQDPLSNFFYGQSFVTRDLFFSGHTATMFLMFLCLQKKTDKYIALAAALTVGFLVLLQHVHYTIDVAAAPILTYIAYRGARAWLKLL